MSTLRRRRIVTAGGVIRWNVETTPPPPPTYKPSRELLAEVALYLLACQRHAETERATRDRALDDADASIAGWRERLDASLHHHYPKEPHVHAA